jgi:hypothetical protein
MKKFVAVVALVVLAGSSFAGPFGLVGRRGYSNNNTAVAPSNGGQQVYYNNRPFLGTAQAAANYMASRLTMGHFGGNSGYEGVGMGATPYQAEMNCCFRQKWNPREVGIAQGSNGMWYACCRY